MPDHLPREHAQISAILTAAVDGIILIDSRGLIQEFNPAAERIFGYSRTEVLGRNVSLLMPEPDASRHDGYIAAYRETRKPRIIGIGREVHGRRRDGTRFPMDLAVGEIAIGDELNFVGIVKDITERKAVEKEVEEGRKQLLVWWENAPIAKAVADLHGRITRANTATESFWGYARNEIVGMTLDRLTHPEDTAAFLVAIGELASGKRNRRTIGVRFLTRDRSVAYGQVHCSAIRSDQDAPPELLLQIVDRTAEIVAEEEAGQHRERLAHVTRVGAMAEMATGIAHEVNQPLTAIATYAQACRRLLDDPATDRADLVEALDQINAQALRAGEIIRRLRVFVRKRESDRELVEINEVVREIVKLANADSNLVDFAIELDLAPGLPPAKIDAVQIQQVVLNLIRNGKESMRGVAPPEETIRVRTRRNTEGQIEVSVRDQGAGLAPENETSLFDPFFTTKKTGMGMGLSISRSIVTAHGGRLWFERNPDRGLTFCFTLPTAIGAEG